MIKRTILVTLFALCLPFLHAGYESGGVISGYEEYVEVSSGLLQVVGQGGANLIEMRNNSHIEIYSTSIPDEYWWMSGIRDIVLGDNSHLDYFGGVTHGITIGHQATAILMNGSIDVIKSMQFTTSVGADPHITLYCQEDSWSWIDGDPLLGIQGLWLDGTSFYLEFQNHSNYDPVYTNIEIVPEPATLALLGLGGLLIRRKK